MTMGDDARSIVRRGNHFIHLNGCGWVLIDGPWFERISAFSQYRPCVRLYSLQPIYPATIQASELYPEMVETREVTWEQVKWMPKLSRLTTRLSYEKFTELIRGRRKFGWRMLPDGVLPAYLCQLELAEDWMHSNYLMERGY